MTSLVPGSRSNFISRFCTVFKPCFDLLKIEYAPLNTNFTKLRQKLIIKFFKKNAAADIYLGTQMPCIFQQHVNIVTCTNTAMTIHRETKHYQINAQCTEDSSKMDKKKKVVQESINFSTKEKPKAVNITNTL